MTATLDDAVSPGSAPVPDPAAAPQSTADARLSSVPGPRRPRLGTRPQALRWESIRATVGPMRSRATVPAALRAFTPLGAATLILGVALWVLGVLLGWDELLVIAACCLLVLVISVPFLFGRLATEAFVEVTPSRVQPGSRVIGRVVVRNGWQRRVRGVLVEVPVGKGLATFPIPGLAPGGEHEELFSIPTRRRSVIAVGPVASARGDALGMFRRGVRWGEPIVVHVHPAIVPVPPIGTGLVRDLEGHTTDHLSNSDVAFHTLREYTPGDDRRHVHWRSSARIGKLLVRQFVDTRRTHVVVHLDEALASYQDDPVSSSTPEVVAEFELAASVAGSIVRRAFADELDLTLLIGDVVVAGASAVPALDAISATDPTDRPAGGTEPWAHASVRIARFTPDASIVVFVTGPRTTPAQIRRAAAPVLRDARILAVRAGTTGRTTWRTSEGITVIDLARLEDLASVLLAGSR